MASHSADVFVTLSALVKPWRSLLSAMLRSSNCFGLQTSSVFKLLRSWYLCRECKPAVRWTAAVVCCLPTTAIVSLLPLSYYTAEESYDCFIARSRTNTAPIHLFLLKKYLHKCATTLNNSFYRPSSSRVRHSDSYKLSDSTTLLATASLPAIATATAHITALSIHLNGFFTNPLFLSYPHNYHY